MIDGYVFGTISVNGNTFNNDVEVHWNGDVLKWQRSSQGLILPEDLAQTLKYEPNMIFIGTGFDGLIKVEDETIKKLRAKGIEPVINKTRIVIQEFNIATYGKKRAIGLFCLN